MPRNSTAIGIDLGTTNSCVGVVRNGRVEIIANDQGHRITPSFVAFTESERLIGDAAKEQAAWNPKNTIYDVKRLIGRKIKEAEVERLISHLPFLVKDFQGSPKVSILYRDQVRVYTPEEISSMVLMKMKEVAETYLGREVKDAVITVPAYFNDSQRQATIDAGTIAGLNVLSIINEPTAAAIAYGVDHTDKICRNILIFDLGGGTYDVVVMKIASDRYDVLAVNGNSFLGGGDFDILMMNHFIREFKQKHGIDISRNDRALGKLRKACEKTKRNLSFSLKERVQIESLVDGIDFNSTLSRVRFEEICADAFSKIIGPAEAVLADSKLSKNEINEIVLVGGSSRIPKIQQLIKDCFNGKILNKTINPDEAVAYGAALHAAVLSGETSMQELTLQDVIPLSLGIKDVSGDFVKIINRNSKIPTKNTVKRTTVSDYQKAVKFVIYEGERQTAKNNHFLGEFTLQDIQIAPKRIPKFDCTFEVDSNGILHASAVDKTTGCQKRISVISNKGRLNQEDIKRMMVEAKEFKEDEDRYQDDLLARGDLEAYCHKIKTKIESNSTNIRLYGKLLATCNEVLLWLDLNERAGKKECHIKKAMLVKLTDDVF